MIYTLTLNPAIDYVAYTDKFSVGNIFRSYNERIFFGGKGINVSQVLAQIGVGSVALGFIAGFTGDALETAMREKNIACDFIRLEKGFTRISVKIRSESETDINGSGPEIGKCDLEKLFLKLNCLKDGDTLILAGSIPPSVNENIYEEIMKSLSGKKIRVAVDTTGNTLLNTLKYRPFLIKPNKEELCELLGVAVNTKEDALYYAKELQKKGALNVLVSMGKDGAVLSDENGKEHFCPAFQGKTVNTVGAGDSMVSGFIAGYDRTKDYSFALKYGSACGSATAFSEGLADINEINRLLNLHD